MSIGAPVNRLQLKNVLIGHKNTPVEYDMHSLGAADKSCPAHLCTESGRHETYVSTIE